MKTSQWLLLVLGAGLILFSLGYWLGLPKMGTVRNFIINPAPTSTSPVSTSTSANSNYVSLASQAPKQAKFVFNLDVWGQDLNSNNIQICSVSASAGSAGDESCYQATPDLIKISYDSNSRTLTLDDVSPEFANSDAIGAFRGCAACTYVVKFSSLHTDEGKTLPNATVEVY